MLQQRIQEVRAKVAEVSKIAQARYGVDLSDVKVLFDLKGRAAGMAGRKGSHFYVRFNTTMMLNDGWNHLINDTVPHELAHSVCQKNPQLGRQHDLGWKSVCRALGGSGERCHKEAVVYAKGKTFRYTTTTGHETNVSETVHNKIQRGVTYRTRGMGKLNNECAYQLVGVSGREVVGRSVAAKSSVTQPVVAPKVVTPAPVQKVAVVNNATQAKSKADVVRMIIKLGKQMGISPKQVIDAVVLQLGMTRSLATAYVKNNWEKV
jgi:predicted SprT family Zn-dependent metalloprotease